MRNYKHTDPEFTERFEYFAFDEVINEMGQQLDDVTRHMAITAALIGCQGIDEFRLEVPRALDAGLTPVMLKEVVYQAVDYLGIGRVRPFLDATNDILTSRGVKLPLEGQATTTLEDRLEKGVQAQVAIFGAHMNEAWKTGHINRWLAANCFGDYYTRTGLDLNQREMITFCFLAAQGGCEPQLIAHSDPLIPVDHGKLHLSRIGHDLPLRLCRAGEYKSAAAFCPCLKYLYVPVTEAGHVLIPRKILEVHRRHADTVL